ncbi:ATP-binding protein [Porphyromonadaceae sp. NP-X]|jgi:signal transduction histidine kinase/HAMP domain-containing protein|nr:ATP-binding protein [Porphyromonadaceae sp. NP-X]NLJ19607.1 two-component sensor histidine kinase [Bacteroidales bacterium]
MKLNKKIFLYFFSIFFVLFVIVTYFQYRREKEFSRLQLDGQLNSYVHTIHNFIQSEKPTWEELTRFVRLFPDSTLRVTIIDSLGNVIFDSSLPKGTHFQNHLNRPEIAKAHKEKIGEAIRHSASTGKNYYYLAERFPEYYIRCALPYNVNVVASLKANMLFLYFMLFMFIITVLALFFISKNFSRSIDRLRIFTQKAEQDDILDTDIQFPNDELGEISNNIVQLYRRMLESKTDADRQREKLFKHLQISHEGLGIFSSDKKEILANTHFIQYTNILADEEVKSSDEIFSIPEFSEINAFIDDCLSNNETKRKRITIEKNGYSFYVQCIVFQDDTFEISINDISTQEHENELKRHLTQNISHELKTPVSSIMGYMESILDNPDIPLQRQRFFIERAYQQTQRLSALLQDISTLNKLDEADQLFAKEPCFLSEIIDEVLNDVRILIEQKNCKVIKNYRSDIKIKGNNSLLYSIFRNLMDNALTYGGENITVEINCYREDNEFYYFSFSDNGPGVAEEHLNRLFERFYRVDKGRSRKMGGTGLGLAIVKNAVLFHKGNISAKNQPGGGLSFIFSLRKY